MERGGERSPQRSAFAVRERNGVRPVHSVSDDSIEKTSREKMAGGRKQRFKFVL